MVRTTRAQREALFKVFQRDFPGWVTPTKRIRNPEIYRQELFDPPMNQWRAKAFAEKHPGAMVKVPSTQYRRFRAKVQPFFGDTCIMIPYAGMWLGIEQDGYTHS